MSNPTPDAAPTLQGVIVNGRERIASRDAMAVLQCETKLVGSVMRSLGWRGPLKLRIPDATGKSVVMAGYERARIQDEIVTDETDTATGDELPAQLERVTRRGLRMLGKVLRHPFDPDNGNLTRSQVTAAGIVINAQLRADEQRMRTKVTGDALARLLKIIEQERRLITQQPVKAEGDDRPSDQATPHEGTETLLEIEPIPE